MANERGGGGLLGMLGAISPDTFRDANGVLTYSTGVPVDPSLSGISNGGGGGGGGDQPPPPYVGGSIQGGIPGVFSPNDRDSALGGMFTMDQYNDQSGNSALANNPTGPQQQLSTNNWRLLPPPFQDPNYYLYNGQIMDRRLTQYTLTPKSVLGLEGGTGEHGYLYQGADEAGRWRHDWDYGYPGQLGPWTTFATPTT